MKIQQQDFSFCAEVTTKLSLLNENIIEIPISYNGRSYKEGKKISFKDAILTVAAIIKYRLKFNV